MIAASKQQALARAFMDLVRSGSGQQVLARHGVQPPGGTGR
jgi:ABC-type molybdate transport system substrate-binding protein